MAKRLDPATWAQIRARYAAGASFGAIAKEFGVSKGTLGERAKAEGWTRGEVPNDPNDRPNDPNGKRSGGGAGKPGRGKPPLPDPPPFLGDPKELEELEEQNARRARFVREYLIDLNGTQAAIRAGYSPASAAQQASELLKDPKVSAAVAAAERLRSERTNVTADRVLLELARLGLADMGDLAEWDAGTVRLRSSSELPPDLSAAVVEVAETKDGVRVKLGKLTALRMLAEHTGVIGRRSDDGGDGHEEALSDLE